MVPGTRVAMRTRLVSGSSKKAQRLRLSASRASRPPTTADAESSDTEWDALPNCNRTNTRYLDGGVLVAEFVDGCLWVGAGDAGCDEDEAGVGVLEEGPVSWR